ncbi:AAA family ATPase [Virgibacillus profundi]|uniref:AAA family ATPase n=1 Tax=Virgibacillus profundi TaxID=2024555 RepID=A0A2A2IEV9_9BACI|nr:DNA topology modulation protein [Virgibacillus profundi]PAV29794.1 AAA family ATPase [Virgibacillus profundi]PXY53966.1 AAA family ATPase [Virgibacillus profundi]
MEKIAIIGGSGAGKSTLAQTLGRILQIPVYHLDAIHWQPGWVPITSEAFIKKTENILNKESWIIDGNYGSTMDLRLQQADTVIFLHYKTVHCLYGIIKRRIHYRNKTRPDMGEDCPEKIDWEFFQWVRKFNKTKVPPIYKRLSSLEDKNIHIFKNRKELNTFLDKLEHGNV